MGYLDSFFVAAGRCHVQPDQAYLFPVTALLEGVALSGTHPLAELGRKKYGLNLPKCNYLSALGGNWNSVGLKALLQVLDALYNALYLVRLVP